MGHPTGAWKGAIPGGAGQPEYLLRHVLESTQQGIVAVDREMRYILWNPYMERFSGLSAEDVLGRRADEVFPFLAETGVTAAMERALEGEPSTVQDHPYTIPGAGLRGWATDTLSPIRSPSGNVEGVLIIVREVSQEREDRAAIGAARDRAQQYLDVAEVMLLALDSEGRIEMINRKGCEVLGRAEMDLLGREWFEVALPPKVRPRVWEVFRRLMSGEVDPVEYTENVVVTAGGEERVLAWHNSLIRGPGGEIRGTFSSGEDVTERRRAQEALETSEERLLLAQRVGRIGVLDRDLAKDTEVWSDVTYEILGLNPETTTPGPAAWVGAIHPQDRSRAIRSLGRLLHGEESAGEEYRVVHFGGQVSWVRWVARVFSSGESRMAGRILAIVQDVTELKEAEAALRDSEERFRGIFEQSPVGIALADPNGVLTGVNSRFAEILGYEAADLVGRSPMDFTHPDDLERSVELSREMLSDRSGGFQVEKRYLRRDGSPVWCRLTSGPVRDEKGRVAYGLGMVQDISQEREAQARLRASEESLRALAARLTHVREEERTAISRELHDELGQALTSLRMDLAMERSALPEGEIDLRTSLGRLIQTTDETLQLVRDLSSRLRPPVLDVMGLGPALVWLVDEHRDRASIRFHLDLPESGPRLPGEVGTCFLRIAQESLTNIFRHAQADNVWIRLVEEEQGLIMAVEDDGRGVTPDQVEVSSSLGILGMRERAMGFGGTLSVAPRPGGGTVVRVAVPIPGTEGTQEGGAP